MSDKSIQEMEHELFLARQRIVKGKENAIFDEINVRQKVMSRAVADIQAIDDDIGKCSFSAVAAENCESNNCFAMRSSNKILTTLNSEHAKTDVKQEYEKSVAQLKDISDKVKEQLNRFKTAGSKKEE